MKTAFALILMLLASAGSALAQMAPFDMSPESNTMPGAPIPGLPATKAPVPVPTTPIPGIPLSNRPAQQQSESLSRRYLLTTPVLKLQGELARQAMSIYLTPEQASADAKLVLSYSNALVVAPEASNILITINDTPVLNLPIRGGQSAQQNTISVPRGVLIPGFNRISFAAEQRHRTDCTIQSTYELWTEVDASKTYLTFADPNANGMKRLDDVRALGVDEKGRSHFTIVSPDFEQPSATPALLQLAQGLSLLSGVANGSFSFTKTMPARPAPGELVVVAATTSQMAGLIGINNAVNADTRKLNGTMAGFMALPGRPGMSVLAFSGPDWRDIKAIADNFVQFAQDGERRMLKTSAWRGVDTPILDKAGALSFSALGLPDQEFSGRRFFTDFTVGMPADFYANHYGTATILLDAAYSSKVLPGSQIVVSVNGHLATTVPITSKGGAVLRHYPIRVTLRHFHPGVNVIGLEAVMMTQEDSVCAPGETADKTARFALFGSSQFVMPPIAHLTQAPDLAATAALGFPFAAAKTPTMVVLGRNDDVTLAAAATVLGKFAASARQTLALEMASSPPRFAGRNAIFIGAAPDLPPQAFTNVQLQTKGAGDGDLSTDVKLKSWRDKIDSGTVMEFFSSVDTWMKETFDLNLATVSLWPSAEAAYTLPQASSAFLSQSVDADGAILTTFSAPDRALLQTGTVDIADLRNWTAISGRVSVYDARKQEIVVNEPTSVSLLSMQPLSISNMRLVAANWLSGNFVIYAGGLVLCAILLGLATNALMALLGRGHGSDKR
ncbi:cellulose biosynthesis cyclic di-GMP-binding regulatory protein BcsB [Agrobacterium vitis]|uniref:cellulose biosynthesis cyclic di-GMP-binding regulatory protein BcsB n=1 Tax=Allorhizobium ampelinum TaxID=3025782 RepID=UPI001F3BF4B2|nr:cellulose biosynthesis cyclic di-GMP-binding regulatory protein BcsB [Allorhizobium ampelinum]